VDGRSPGRVDGLLRLSCAVGPDGDLLPYAFPGRPEDQQFLEVSLECLVLGEPALQCAVAVAGAAAEQRSAPWLADVDQARAPVVDEGGVGGGWPGPAKRGLDDESIRSADQRQLDGRGCYALGEQIGCP
jgi:hypothetical protein